jgi:hypothetical protein
MLVKAQRCRCGLKFPVILSKLYYSSTSKRQVWLSNKPETDPEFRKFTFKDVTF